MSEEGSFDSLNYALQGTRQNLESWGSEYLRSLSSEVSAKFHELAAEDKDTSDLTFLIDVIAPYSIKHNEEPEAIDLLMEVNQIEKIVTHCNKDNYKRVC